MLVKKLKYLLKISTKILIVIFLLQINGGLLIAHETGEEHPHTIKDTDLDGISDEAEINKYNTNPSLADTDGDGVLDVQEIADDTNPSDAKSSVLYEKEQLSKTLFQRSTPIMWLVGRISGVAAFIMFTLVICAGLLMTSKLLLKFPFMSAPNALETHSFNATFIGLGLLVVHIVALMLDETVKLKIQEVFVPMLLQRDFKSALGYDLTVGVALGIIAMYLALLLVITSQLRSKIVSVKIWRMIHYSSFLFFILFVAHGFFTGTDSQEPWMKAMYIGAVILVVFLLLLRIFGKKYFLPTRPAQPAQQTVVNKTVQTHPTQIPQTELPKPKKHTAKLKTKVQQNNRVVEVNVEFGNDDEMKFIAGQFVSLKVGENTFRSYSISSDARKTKKYSMLIENKHVGIGSNYINQLKEGDTMEFVGPSGRFILPKNPTFKINFIATGTGVAPILSMLQQLMDMNYQYPVRLYFGVYCADDLLKKDFLDLCEKTLKDFRYILCFENELTESDKKDNHIKRGLVTKLIDLEDTSNAIFGICGHPNMCADMKQILLDKNVSESNIFHEKFSVAAKQPVKRPDPKDNL